MKAAIIKLGLVAILFPLMFSSCKKDDPSFIVQFETSAINVSESSGTLNVPVILPEGAQSANVTVNYSAGGNAVENADYTIANKGTVTVNAGSVSGNIAIELIHNIEQDGNKDLILEIISVTYNDKDVPQGTLNQVITITITDDECSPYIKGNWNYTANYYSVLNGENIPTGQNGQGLGEEDDPDFTGTVEILDPEGNRSYQISDAIFGQFSALGFDAPGVLLDNCGALSTPADGSVMLMGAFNVFVAGTIDSPTKISLTWTWGMGGATLGGGNVVLIKAGK
jgi:hypothetical protein